MTTDSPKGPEREAQIEIKRLEENEQFLERAVHLVLGCCDASDVPCEERDAEALYAHVRSGTTPTTQRALSGLLRGMATKTSDFRRALAFADAHVPQWERVIAEHKAEVEWLTAEVDRLVQERGEVREALLPLLQRHPLSKDDVQGDNLKAGYIAKIAADVLRWYGYEMQRWEATFGKDALPHATAVIEERDQLRAEVSRLREQLAAQPELPQDAEARITALLERYWADVRDGKREDAGDDAEAEQAHEVVQLIRSWGVSSSEVEAPRPREVTQHKVVVAPHGKDWWQAECSACGVTNYTQSRERAGDWKDEHEADTLVPQVESPNRQANQHGEGRPSGSERLAPRPVETFDCKQDCPAVEPECFCIGTEPHRLCCHENAAQAARSEATREARAWKQGDAEPPQGLLLEDLYGDRLRYLPRGGWAWVRVNGQDIDMGAGLGLLWHQVGWHNVGGGVLTEVLDEVPSPSLPKEGEDTHG